MITSSPTITWLRRMIHQLSKFNRNVSKCMSH